MNGPAGAPDGRIAGELRLQAEKVSITPGRKRFTVLAQRRQRQARLQAGRRARFGLRQHRSQGINDQDVAAVVMPIAVGAYAVATGDVYLVFNGARRQLVGYVQRQIVVLLIARPQRKAQVITDQPRQAGLIMVMLAGHSEQMTFIIAVHHA